MRRLIVVIALALIVALTWWWTGRDDEPVTAGPSQGAAPVVLVQPLTRREFADETQALGTTRAAESVDITARVTNVITEIHFGEGQFVQAGAVLADLESSEARADYAAAQAALVESRGQYTRSRELFRTSAVSESQVEQLQAQMRANEAALAAAEARVADHRIRAPFAGRVGLRRVSLGALVSPGTVITTLDDLSTILLDFDVPETHMAAIEARQTLTARSAAYPDVAFEGVVETVDSRVDPQTRAVRVRARLPNELGLLRPGMFMTVRVLRASTPLLLVPEQALVPRQDRQYLFVVEDGVVREVEVEVGRRVPGYAEIVAGADEGDAVIIEGTQHVRDGAAVQARPWQEPRR
ncbi:MAG: efflux RND transporter periplasmic adaptor subunit [Gammaproteobacteria bacterium]